MTAVRDLHAARRRSTKGRVAHGVVCVVFATGVAALLVSLFGSEPEPQVIQRLAAVTAISVVPGLVLAASNAATLRAGGTSAAWRGATAAGGVLALGLLVAVVAVAVAGPGSSTTVPLALLAALIPAYEVLLAGATASAQGRETGQ